MTRRYEIGSNGRWYLRHRVGVCVCVCRCGVCVCLRVGYVIISGIIQTRKLVSEVMEVTFAYYATQISQ